MAARSHLRAEVGAIAHLAGLVVLAGGCAVLIGWILNVGWLKQPLPAGVSMKVNTALALILAGASLRTAAVRPLLSRVLGLLVALIGVLTLTEYVLGWDLGIDELMFLDETATAPPAGRMAPTTAFCFAALGTALGVARGRTWIAHPLALAAMLVSSVASVGYLYHVEALYQEASSYTAVAFHTAVLIVVLAIGVLWRDPPAGVMAVIRADDLGGFASRRLLWIAVPLPVLLGWLTVEGQRANLYGVEFGTAFLVVLTIGVMASVIGSVATTIGSTDAARQKASHALVTLNATLEERVAHQTATLRNRETELRLVTEKALDAFVAIDAGGRICDWNQACTWMACWRRRTRCPAPSAPPTATCISGLIATTSSGIPTPSRASSMRSASTAVRLTNASCASWR